MKLPIQAKPVIRGMLTFKIKGGDGVSPSNWQCWTGANCDELATNYGNTVADCCNMFGIQSARGINHDQGAGCQSCLGEFTGLPNDLVNIIRQY